MKMNIRPSASGSANLFRFANDVAASSRASGLPEALLLEQGEKTHEAVAGRCAGHGVALDGFCSALEGELYRGFEKLFGKPFAAAGARHVEADDRPDALLLVVLIV